MLSRNTQPGQPHWTESRPSISKGLQDDGFQNHPVPCEMETCCNSSLVLFTTGSIMSVGDVDPMTASGLVRANSTGFSFWNWSVDRESVMSTEHDPTNQTAARSTDQCLLNNVSIFTIHLTTWLIKPHTLHPRTLST